MTKITAMKKNTAIDFTSIWNNPLHFIACGFGIGTFPIAPGTAATLATIPLCIILSRYNIWIYSVIVAIMVIMGVWLCGKTNKDFGTEDHPAAVWDEIACFPACFIALPMHWHAIVLGFVLFRFFDIIKPGPIGWIDRRIHGGIGVMLDDLAAAAATWIVLALIYMWQ